MAESGTKDSYIGVSTYLGPPSTDKFGTFYLVRGTDGALYRLGQASGTLTKLVNSGDWGLYQHEDSLPTPKQEGLETLNGRMVSLSEDYPKDFLSNQLIRAGAETAENELEAENFLARKSIEDISAPLFVSSENITIKEDVNTMPPSGKVDDLRDFVAEKSDFLDRVERKTTETEKI
tara:strand:- start:5248 stop:5778 length:531 start_codon:yes stop_codon:yes gene_type:complete